MARDQSQIHVVHSIDDRLQLIAQQIAKGETDPWLRKYAYSVVRGLPQHGRIGEEHELGAIFWHVKNNIEYRLESRNVDIYATAQKTLEAGAGDCFSLDTKIIVKSKATGCYEIVSLGALEQVWPAYQALSYDFSKADWSFEDITGWAYKGVREVCTTRLDNGVSFQHTADHKVWWLDGQKPSSGKICEDALGRCLKEQPYGSNRVLIAEKIPVLRRSDITRDEAYLAGIYAAEGFADAHHVRIAQDNAKVRERIESALEGIPYSASRRSRHAYYSVKQSPAKAWLRSIGTNSFDMQLPPDLLSGDEASARVLIAAHADGDAYIPKAESTWASKVAAIHACSSPQLVDQLQLLLMQCGDPWYTQLQLSHGGVGTKPIYRVHRWLPTTQPARRSVRDLPGLKYSCLRETTPSGEAPVADISVANTHNFVLSNGMVAHNCDDHTVLVCSLLSNLGWLCGAKVVSADGNGWHIYPIVGFPKNNPSQGYVALDTTQAPSIPGWEPGFPHQNNEIRATFIRGRADSRPIRRGGRMVA